MSLKQPVTQVRLTNVAVVRLRQHGHRFEVACYKNKVLNWRAGIEDDLQEVLQTNAVFHNVSKGEFAKRDALLAVFNTADQEKICRIILDKGELQISEKERQAALAAAFQDVITLVIEMTVNVRTGLPLTRTACASALKQVGFGVKLGVASKAQALKAVALLQRKLGANAIARRMMRLKAECGASHRDEVRKFIEQCGGVVELEALLGDAPDAEAQGKGDRDCKPGTARAAAQHAVYSVTFLNPASYYRDFDTLLQSLRGSLFLLAANCIQGCLSSATESVDAELPVEEHATAGRSARRAPAGESPLADDIPDILCEGASQKRREKHKKKNEGRRARRGSVLSDDGLSGAGLSFREMPEAAAAGGTGKKKREGRRKLRHGRRFAGICSFDNDSPLSSLSAVSRRDVAPSSPEEFEAAAMAWLRRDAVPLPREAGGEAALGALDSASEATDEEPTEDAFHRARAAAQRSKKERKRRGRENRRRDEWDSEEDDMSKLNAGRLSSRPSHTGSESHSSERRPRAGGDRDLLAVAPRAEGATEALPDAAETMSERAHVAARGSEKAGAFSCRTCQMGFEGAAEHRQHCKSSLHAMNLKRRIKNLPPLTEEGWQEAQLDEQLVQSLEGLVLPEY
ncbi:rRNA metabolism protein, SBDS family protein [Besnoitia besnoiti]|uniref:rRNA metabolism protein, SBDS family protein n=1 Tax=Besnoitia besnoiti TaxID=94643 RepID=A0A2A9MFA3_BESBE|nr:rRNA metabolism protein, SBDS family protein [Besnoitia besnoiti]PFH34636.1 rRNA metabolism protein, SBDS family protein [Besnoitia besnoiti]